MNWDEPVLDERDIARTYNTPAYEDLYTAIHDYQAFLSEVSSTGPVDKYEGLFVVVVVLTIEPNCYAGAYCLGNLGAVLRWSREPMTTPQYLHGVL